jgi:hypothetical protein
VLRKSDQCEGSTPFMYLIFQSVFYNVCWCVSIHCVLKVSNSAVSHTPPNIGYDCVKHVGIQRTFLSHMTKSSFHLKQ